MRSCYQLLTLVLLLALVEVAKCEYCIVYSWSNGSISQIYRANQDFSQVQQLTNSVYHAGSPAVSPDGRWVVYTQFEADNRSNLWIMNSDGSGTPRQLTFQTTLPSHRAFMPSWHPNGQKIYYTQEIANGPTIREVSIDGSGDNLVVNVPSYDPVINPANTNQLAFISQIHYSQDGELRLRALTDGTETVLLAPNGAADYDMMISPDGQYLLWAEQENGSNANFALKRMLLSDHTVTTLVPARAISLSLGHILLTVSTSTIRLLTGRLSVLHSSTE